MKISDLSNRQHPEITRDNIDQIHDQAMRDERAARKKYPATSDYKQDEFFRSPEHLWALEVGRIKYQFEMEDQYPFEWYMGSISGVVVYHGTTEQDARNGLKNPDDFNSDWMEDTGLSRFKPIHFADNFLVAKAYATSGLSRDDAKEAQAVEGVCRKIILDKYGVNVFLNKNYGINKDVPSDIYKIARKEFTVIKNEQLKKIQSRRGTGAFVVQTTLTSNRVAIFKNPFPESRHFYWKNKMKEFSFDYGRDVDVIYFPDSNLRPENAKGKCPRSGYYIVLNKKIIGPQIILDANTGRPE